MSVSVRRQPVTTPPALPLWVVREWQTAYLRVRGTAAALHLWHRVLSDEDRRRLGGDPDAAYARYGGAVGMWRHLRGVSVPRAVVAVGVKTGFLDPDAGRVLPRALGEEPDDPREAVEAAVAAGDLVLAESPRRVYWAGEPIDIDWVAHTKPWELLWELARASKGGAAVDANDLREREVRDPGFLRKMKCRLVNAAGFPPTLADAILPAGRGTYRLGLPPARIRVFERGAGEAVREWTP